MQAKEKVDILTLVRHLEEAKAIADKVSRQDSAQAAISDLISIWLESVAEVDLGLSFCGSCERMTDEIANDDDNLCPDCAVDARHRAYDRQAYLTRHEG